MSNLLMPRALSGVLLSRVLLRLHVVAGCLEKVSLELPASSEAAYILYSNLQRQPEWSPWLKSVEVRATATAIAEKHPARPFCMRAIYPTIPRYVNATYVRTAVVLY